MGRRLELSFDREGNRVGFVVTGETSHREGGIEVSKRLMEVTDPGNSGDYFRRQVDAIENASPGRRLNLDPGIKS